MENRVFIIHGWDGNPTEAWKGWLKDQLEQKKYHVVAPSLPNAENPVVADWLAKIQKTVGKPDKKTFLVGHSLGCLAILKYIESLDEKDKIGGCILVAGFIDGVKDPSLKEWMENKIDVAKVRKICKKIVAISSDNDPLITNEQTKHMVDSLKAKFILERRKRHLGEDDQIYQLPSVLNAVLEMSR
jgi:predicted alpha/beta hydrolase family esterase